MSIAVPSGRRENTDGVDRVRDRRLMMMALAFARRAQGRTNPNPAVGALITNGNEVIGCGWHRKAGRAHAEVEALAAAGERARGGTLYVTLEPCNHHGRTPPCTEAIIRAGISRVVIAARDPNRRVKGQGIRRLVEAGIRVEVGLCAEQAHELTAIWRHSVTTGQPFVGLWAGMSLDGMLEDAIAPQSAAVRRLRTRLIDSFDCCLVDGANCGFLLQEELPAPAKLWAVYDPQLRSLQPLRLVEKIGRGAAAGSLVVFAGADAEFGRRAELERRGVQIVILDDGDGGVELSEAVSFLGRKKGVQGLLVLGGAQLCAAVLAAGIGRRLWIARRSRAAGGGGSFIAAHGDRPGIFRDDRHKLRLLRLLTAQRLGTDALLQYDCSS